MKEAAFLYEPKSGNALLGGKRRQRTIQIVEDDPMITRALSIRLGSYGYRVVKSSYASSASVCTLLESPDLLIIDLTLPDGSGVDVARELVRSHPSVPFLFMSAQKHEQWRQKAGEFADAVFIEKPFVPGDLIRAIEHIIGR